MERQWRDSYSAKELAKAWCVGGAPECPANLRALFDYHPLTRGALLVEGGPEHVTVLPERGEGRNHDMWIRAEAAGSGLTICIEAKVEESFGEPIGAYVQSARQRNPRTGIVKRAKALLRIVTGKEIDPEFHEVATLRYQLLSGVAGTVLQAQKDRSPIAIFVVHEFRRRLSHTAKVQTNAADLSAFVSLLGGRQITVDAGMVHGPWTMSAGVAGTAAVKVLLGKIVTALDD